MEQRVEPKIGIIIVAGGSGKRAGGATPKQFQILGQRPLLAYTIDGVSKALPNAEIVVVLAEDRVDYWRNLSARFDVANHKIVSGGEERYHSVKCGLTVMSDLVDIIGVHDGARPFCSEELIQRCANVAISSGSAIPVVMVSDSIRAVSVDNDISSDSKSICRSSLRAVQTPQMFDASLIRRAYNQPYQSSFTDDASLVEAMGERVWLCEGESRNIKITTREEMLLAQIIMEERENGTILF